MLTEAEVRRSYQIIMKKPDSDPEAYDKAEALLDELRPESPLRLRLHGRDHGTPPLAASQSDESGLRCPEVSHGG